MGLFGPNLKALEQAGDIEGLLAALTHKNPKVRARVPGALERLADPEAIIPLIGYLCEPSKRLAELEQVLAGLVAQSGTAKLVEALADPRARVRRFAADYLLELDEHDAVEGLLTVLTDPACYEPAEAIPLLGRIQHQAAIAPLFDYLAEEKLPDREREATLKALARLRPFWDESMVGRLLGLVNDSHEPVRHFALDQLGRLGSAEALAPLLELVGDPQTPQATLEKTLKALLQLNQAGVVEGLIGLLAVAEGARGRLLVEALAAEGSMQATQGLIDALASPDWKLRLAVVEALGRLGSQAAIGPLLELVGDPLPEIRRAVIEALCATADPRAPGGLIQALADMEPAIRLKAVKRMAELAEASAAPAFIGRLADTQSEIRWRAAEALGRLSAQEALQPLAAALADEVAEVRAKAAEALGRLGDPAAVEPVIKVLTDNSELVCYAAIEALGRIGDGRAVEPLAACLAETEDALNREVAAEVLTRIGDYRALKPLRAAGFENGYKALAARLLKKTNSRLRGVSEEAESLAKTLAKAEPDLEAAGELLAALEERLAQARQIAEALDNAGVLAAVEEQTGALAKQRARLEELLAEVDADDVEPEYDQTPSNVI